MRNSSEEYVSKGKIPPGGRTPLPNSTANAVASATLTASVGLVPDPTIPQKKPLVRAIPVTSLDDDSLPGELTKETLQKSERDVEADMLVSAMQKSHNEAQELFDKARTERQMAALSESMVQAHQQIEEVFQKMRAEKEAEQLETQKRMAEFAQQAAELHVILEQIFANVGKEKATETTTPPPTPSPRTAAPMTALMDELKSKTPVVEAGAQETDDSVKVPTVDIETVPETAVAPPTPTTNEQDTLIVPKPTQRRDVPTTLMLSELKQAFSDALKSEGDGDDESIEDVSISPSAIAQRRESPAVLDKVAEGDSQQPLAK